MLDAVPSGHLVDARWLVRQGLSHESMRDYVNGGWLERLAQGVFLRPGPGASARFVDWRTCVISMQHVMGYDLHVGGTTALAIAGHVHYLGLGAEPTVQLYGERVPGWIHRIPLSAPIRVQRRSLFHDPRLSVSDAVSAESLRGAGAPSAWTLRHASPERAILEALDALPERDSFDALDLIFEGLANLRPKRLRALLADCRKIKVKRLFFVFADRHRHAWRKYVDPAEFDLGKGDRALVKGGRIHSVYRIVVPEAFAVPHLEVADGDL